MVRQKCVHMFCKPGAGFLSLSAKLLTTNRHEPCHYFAACTCVYMNNTYKYDTTVYETHDGDGTCISGVCGPNGTIIGKMAPCHTHTTTTPFTFTTTGKIRHI